MELFVKRAAPGDLSTLGALYIGDDATVPECYTLELPLKDGLPGSAIPDGRYQVILAPSPKFQLEGRTDSWIARYADQMPHIVGIPNRSLIMFHWGNLADETHGCILVGTRTGTNAVFNSRAAFEDLYPRIAWAVTTPSEGCWVTIKSAMLATDHALPTEAARPAAIAPPDGSPHP